LWSQPVQDVMVAENSNDLGEPVKIEWLSKNAVPVRSIDPDDDDFADLMPMKDILGNAKIVMLGEASHGDGATFYAKQRFVRFLHEVMGFDILAWESRFFAMEEMNRELESGQPIWIDSAWDESGVTKPIYQYSRATLKTDRPLRHTGVDIIFGYPRARGIDRYRERLFKFLDAEGPNLISPSDHRMISEFFLTVQKGSYSPSEEESANVRAAISRMRENLCEKATIVQDRREIEYFAKTLEDLAAYEQHLILSNSMDMPRGFPENMLFRSRKMGENLIWLAKEWYPEQKIIVWAANRHVARNVSSIKILRPDTYAVAVQLPPEYREMGYFIHKELGQSVYSIAFVTYQGTRGRPEQKPMSIKSIPGCIESLWHNTGHRYGFLDFRSVRSDHWLCKPLLAHVDGGAIERAKWTNVFDSMFYIDTMFPATESGEVPEGIHTKR
jgi:erythromycin esterase